MNVCLSGRRAIVCGASRGLGFACAQALATEGAQVTIVARGRKRLENAARKIETACNGCGVNMVEADLGEPESVLRIMEACTQPDLLITNCGRLPEGNAFDFGRRAWIDAIERSLVTPLELIKTAVEGMRNRRFGRIVNIMGSSLKAPLPTMALTNAARGGLAAIVAAMSRDLIGDNVTINNVLVGLVETEGLSELWERRAVAQGTTAKEVRHRSLERIPARRFGLPNEVAAMCVMLCHGEFGYMTGQSILIDGGMQTGIW